MLTIAIEIAKKNIFLTIIHLIKNANSKMKNNNFYTIVTKDSVNVKYKCVVPSNSSIDRFHLSFTEGTAFVMFYATEQSMLSFIVLTAAHSANRTNLTYPVITTLTSPLEVTGKIK